MAEYCVKPRFFFTRNKPLFARGLRFLARRNGGILRGCCRFGVNWFSMGCDGDWGLEMFKLWVVVILVKFIVRGVN